MQTTAIPLTPSLSVAAPPGAWMRAPDGRFVQVIPRRFGLHPIEETDPRFHALARRERVEVATVPPFILWGPENAPSHSVRHVGLIARALDAASAPSYADLLLAGTPYAFLRGDAELAIRAWPRAWCECRGDRWFTYDGAELYSLVRVWTGLAGQLIVDVERVGVA